jgi:hypothetical protein
MMKFNQLEWEMKRKILEEFRRQPEFKPIMRRQVGMAEIVVETVNYMDEGVQYTRKELYEVVRKASLSIIERRKLTERSKSA